MVPYGEMLNWFSRAEIMTLRYYAISNILMSEFRPSLAFAVRHLRWILENLSYIFEFWDTGISDSLGRQPSIFKFQAVISWFWRSDFT